jgi:trans-2,3-dihydro-3-hydroxyanthranilate isomerase
MRLQFQTVDVFTSDRFAGNPLAVVLNAEGLSAQQMQTIAAEFNLAETTFIRPPKDAAHTAEVRIFTPRSEMPFAGHPNVGTAFVLAHAGISYGRPVTGDSVIFEEKAGLVPIELLRDGATVVGARLASPQPLSVGAEVAIELVASACGISRDDIEIANHRPCIASCGAPFILAELKSRAALAAASPNGDVFRLEVTKHPAVSIMIYTQVDEGDVDIRARMFAPHQNIPEDPATGSANVALIGKAAPGAKPFIVEDDRSGRRDGTPESAEGACGKARRHRHRDLHRRALRARDVRNNRAGVKRSKVFRTGVDDLPEIHAVLDLLHLGG